MLVYFIEMVYKIRVRECAHSSRQMGYLVQIASSSHVIVPATLPCMQLSAFTSYIHPKVFHASYPSS